MRRRDCQKARLRGARRKLAHSLKIDAATHVRSLHDAGAAGVRRKILRRMPISCSLNYVAVVDPAAPPILLIAREPILPGGASAYREIEEETARLSAALGCPHPYLAMESLTGPHEIWWFNGFVSTEDVQQVGDAYQKNLAFAAALRKNSERKAPFTGKITEVYTQYRPEFSSGPVWIPGRDRFAVIATTRELPPSAGTVFEAADGTFFVFSGAASQEEADRLAASTSGSTVAVVRPLFSFPAKEWVAADPDFWGQTG